MSHGCCCELKPRWIFDLCWAKISRSSFSPLERRVGSFIGPRHLRYWSADIKADVFWKISRDGEAESIQCCRSLCNWAVMSSCPAEVWTDSISCWSDIGQTFKPWHVKFLISVQVHLLRALVKSHTRQMVHNTGYFVSMLVNKQGMFSFLSSFCLTRGFSQQICEIMNRVLPIVRITPKEIPNRLVRTGLQVLNPSIYIFVCVENRKSGLWACVDIPADCRTLLTWWLDWENEQWGDGNSGRHCEQNEQ